MRVFYSKEMIYLDESRHIHSDYTDLLDKYCINYPIQCIRGDDVSLIRSIQANDSDNSPLQTVIA